MASDSQWRRLLSQGTGPKRKWEGSGECYIKPALLSAQKTTDLQHKKGKFPNLCASFQSTEDGQPFYTSCVFKDLFKQASQLLNKSDHPQFTKEGAES